MIDWLNAWTELRQGGNLLGPTELSKGLPEAQPPRSDLAERLRAALAGLPEDGPADGDEFGALLDLVLEGALGLHAGWRKGSAVGAADGERLLDGTTWKPRRLWTSPARATLASATPDLAVFVVDADRIGIGKGRRPVAHATEYLRKKHIPLALLTNGRTWRLLWADEDNVAWVEWDADRWVHGDHLTPAFAVLVRVLGYAAVSRPSDDAASALQLAIREARRGQGRVSKDLGERVRRAVEELLYARRDRIDAERDQHKLNDVYVAACHVIMRLVVLLFAEGRELLPVDNPVYYEGYSLSGLLEHLDRLGSRRRGRSSAWPRLIALFRLLYEGSPHQAMLVTAYGSELFQPGSATSKDPIARAVALIEASGGSVPDDEAIYRLLMLLTRTEQAIREGTATRKVKVPVRFNELTSEYIGILYEGLLDYELNRAEDQPILFLAMGDQPAMPIGELESMDAKATAALLEKVRVGRAQAADDEVEDDADGEEPEAEEEEEPVEGADDTAPDGVVVLDDTRAKALDRAMRWARDAALASGLVRKPKGKHGADDPAWQSERDRVAKGLIARTPAGEPAIVLPGELYLVRWGGTRKGSGSFYTRPPLTLPTVRETLRPLLRDATGRIRSPEDILKLKVCDPAMGSGSFLVAALRVLTDAVIEALHVHQRLRVQRDQVAIDCAMLPEADRKVLEERLEPVVRRAVVEQCLYGVDKNKLAVELGRVALWIETLHPRLPLTFLDHKLKKGDALVGAWLDTFAETPILAWWRETGDEKHLGVHHEQGTWSKALLERRVEAVAAMAAKAQKLLGPGLFDDATTETMLDGLRDVLAEMRRLPLAESGRRAEVYRAKVVDSVPHKRLRAAMDRWCALWFWPGDELPVAPLDVNDESDGVRDAVERIATERGFFHWEIEFPDVFYRGHEGFDAIVGNPPWEIQKPSSKEFFSNVDPLYRTYGKQDALRKQKELFQRRPDVERDWLDEVAGLKALGNFVRHAGRPFGDAKHAEHEGGAVSLSRKRGDDAAWHEALAKRRAAHRGHADPEHPFRHQGSADLNTYKLFFEQAHNLVREGGQFGMLVPSGLYTDKGTGDLRRLLLDRCRWRWLYGFENRNKLFDIHRSFKFAVVIAGKGGSTDALHAAFMRHDLEDWAEAKGALAYPAERVKRFSPKSLSVLEIQSARDLEVLSKIYDNSVLLGDESEDGWGIEYGTEFHMTNDSKLFIARDKAEALGYRSDDYGRWFGPSGDVLLPLYEGRMIGQFDFSEKGWVSGKGRSAVWREIPWTHKTIEPQFLMRMEDYVATRESRPSTPRVGFMDVTSATNKRTMIAALLPPFPCGNKVPLLATRAPKALVAALNSFCFDWQLRQRLGGITLNYFIVEEAALPRPATWPALSRLAVRLNCVAPLFAQVFAADPGFSRTVPWKRLWALKELERVRLRAMLDAAVACLSGLDRTAFRWILRDCDHPIPQLADGSFTRSLDGKGFWRIDRQKHPELRHTILALIAFDALEECIRKAGGDVPTGIETFCEGDDGDGWQLPTSIRLADYDLGRDERARGPQPVAEALGHRFDQSQLAANASDSWAECERHAEAAGTLVVNVSGTAHGTRSAATTPTAENPPPIRVEAGTATAKWTANPAQALLFGQGAEPKTSRGPMHIQGIHISNFKNWGAAGNDYDRSRITLAPVTLVLGMNSAGKTSILLPLRMLKQTVEATDPGVHLVLDGTKADGVDLGSWDDVIHKHDVNQSMSIRLDLDDQLTLEVAFRMDSGGLPVIERLVWEQRKDAVVLLRKPATADYQFVSARFNLPNWDGAKDIHTPKREAYEPRRGIELTDRALGDLGSTLGPRLRANIQAVKEMFEAFHYLGPIRVPPERNVTWSQQQVRRLGSSGARAIDVLIGSQAKKETRELLSQVSGWLKRLDLADAIEIERLGTSLLYQVVVVRGAERTNLADVGFGVSQVLPVIVLLHFVPEGSIVLLEDPDAHLHPTAQAVLADLFAEVGRARNLQILVETHSEHIFRRLQFLVAEGTRLTEKDCALYYVRRDQPTAHIERLQVDAFGRVKNWPSHFFGDAIGETERQMEKMFGRMEKERGDAG